MQRVYICFYVIYKGILMKILVTGIPCSGKTYFSKKLSKKHKLKHFEEKDFVNSKNSKLSLDKVKDVDLGQFSKVINKKLPKNFVLSGLLSPYCLSKYDFDFDIIFVLMPETKILKERLKKRKYSDLKIIENLFVQEQNLIIESIAKELKNRKKPLILPLNDKIIKKLIE
jgi:broad-specificity NMP kinase